MPLLEEAAFARITKPALRMPPQPGGLAEAVEMSLWLYRRTYKLERSPRVVIGESLRNAQRKSQFDFLFPAQPRSTGPSRGSPHLPPEPGQRDQPLPKAAASALILVRF